MVGRRRDRGLDAALASAANDREALRVAWDLYVKARDRDERERAARAEVVRDAVLAAWRDPGIVVGRTIRPSAIDPATTLLTSSRRGRELVTEYVLTVPGLDRDEVVDGLSEHVLHLIDADARIARLSPFAHDGAALGLGRWSFMVAVPDRW